MSMQECMWRDVLHRVIHRVKKWKMFVKEEGYLNHCNSFPHTLNNYVTILVTDMEIYLNMIISGKKQDIKWYKIICSLIYFCKKKKGYSLYIKI